MLKTLLTLMLLAGAASANPQCYVEGYPDLITSADESAIILKDKTRFPYHTDTPKKSWDEKINNADLATQLLSDALFVVTQNAVK